MATSAGVGPLLSILDPYELFSKAAAAAPVTDSWPGSARAVETYIYEFLFGQ